MHGQGHSLGDAINLFRCCVFTWNILAVVLPAFLIAGAIEVLVPSQSIMRYLGAKAHPAVSYGASAFSGNVLSVCSCNVVPIFQGILRRGAGIGPAFCFVFAAPAIHIVNTIMTYKIIAPQFAIARFITVPIVAILTGLIMYLLFRREEKARQAQMEMKQGQVALVKAPAGQARKAEAFLGLLMVILVFGAWMGLDERLGERYQQRAQDQWMQADASITFDEWLLQKGYQTRPELKAWRPGTVPLTEWMARKGYRPTSPNRWLLARRETGRSIGVAIRIGCVLLMVGLLTLLARRWFSREEATQWWKQSGHLAWKILIIFIPAVIVIAFIIQYIPTDWITPTGPARVTRNAFAFGYPQGNRLLPTFLAALFSTLMYFPMLTEIAFTKGLLIQRFAVGPTIALLLGGPGLSLPGLLLVARVAGWKKTVAYWLITLVLITLVAYIIGSIWGQAWCTCTLQKQKYL